MKIALLNNGANSRLGEALIGIDMPPLDNYFAWRYKAGEIVGHLEAYQYNTSTERKKVNILQQPTKTGIDRGPVKDLE